jgi:hypothetical protein
VTALSSAGMNGAATRRRAATSPVANEPATIQPIRPLGPGSGRDGRSWPSSLGVGVGVVGVVVTMDSIPCTVGVARVQPSALVARAAISTLGPFHHLTAQVGPGLLRTLKACREGGIVRTCGRHRDAAAREPGSMDARLSCPAQEVPQPMGWHAVGECPGRPRSGRVPDSGPGAGAQPAPPSATGRRGRRCARAGDRRGRSAARTPRSAPPGNREAARPRPGGRGRRRRRSGCRGRRRRPRTAR